MSSLYGYAPHLTCSSCLISSRLVTSICDDSQIYKEKKSHYLLSILICHITSHLGLPVVLSRPSQNGSFIAYPKACKVTMLD